MTNFQAIVRVIIVLLAVGLVVAALLKLAKAAAVIAALIIVVPILCTIMWGDGQNYVSKIAEFFQPEIEQKINDGYQIYHDQNAKDPVVDLERLTDLFGR